jgi:hypothetical protein
MEAAHTTAHNNAQPRPSQRTSMAEQKVKTSETNRVLTNLANKNNPCQSASPSLIGSNENVGGEGLCKHVQTKYRDFHDNHLHKPRMVSIARRITIPQANAIPKKNKILIRISVPRKMPRIQQRAPQNYQTNQPNTDEIETTAHAAQPSPQHSDNEYLHSKIPSAIKL